MIIVMKDVTQEGTQEVLDTGLTEEMLDHFREITPWIVVQDMYMKVENENDRSECRTTLQLPIHSTSVL